MTTLDDYCGSRDTAGAFENQVLYRMCRDHPHHDDPYVTAGKVLAIGRIYAASPERGAGKAQPDAGLLGEAIGRALRDSELDAKLDAIPFQARLAPAMVPELVNAHKLVVDEVSRATKKWSIKATTKTWEPRTHISFASKYLHFHRPNAFPIYDQYVRAGLQCANGKGASTYEGVCRGVLKAMARTSGDWTPRSIDTWLVIMGKAHQLRTEATCPYCSQQR